MNDAGDVLPSSSFEFFIRSSVVGGPVPQEGGGLGRARTLQGLKVPLVPMLRWSAGMRGGDSGHGRAILLRFGLLYILARLAKCTKMQNWRFCQVLTITTEANLKQIHRCQMPIQCCICINSHLTH